MTRFHECLQPQGAKAVLLSIKPRYADQIVAGTKTVEFRRQWTKQEVGVVVVYSSAPVQRLVAILDVEGLVIAPASKLWSQCKERGPGLLKAELMAYLAGKDLGHGILLGARLLPPKPVPPRSVLRNFQPPQSYCYLTPSQLKRVGAKFGLEEAGT